MARKSRKHLEQVSEAPAFEIPMYQTALYIRLSIEDNKKRGNSIESQKAILENYIKLNPELVVYDIYVDNGNTGTNFERAGFKSMMADVEAGKVNCIIVKDLSRLGRNAIDTGYYIEKYFPLHNVRFISVNDRYDSIHNDNIHGGIILPLKNMINEAYSLDIGRKIKAQAQQSMKDGDYIGARPPYGYLKSPDNCHKLIVDEEAATVIRMIFEWAYDKQGLNTIVKRLNDAGIISPSHYKKKQGLIKHENLVGTGNWQTFTVNKILSDEVYLGDMVQGKTKSINHKQTPVSKENWIVVRNTHEPIISRVVFDAVQVHREQVAAQSIEKRYSPYTENIFRGKIFCACCGKSMHRQRQPRRKGPDAYYFHCIANSRINKDACASSMMMNEIDIRKKVVDFLRQSVGGSGNNILSSQSDLLLKERKNEVSTAVLRLKQDIDKRQRLLHSLYENLVKGIISKKEYLAMKSEYEARIADNMDEIISQEVGLKEFEAKISEHREQADSMKQVADDGELSAALIDKLIERIEISPNKEVSVWCYKTELDGRTEEQPCSNM